MSTASNKRPRAPTAVADLLNGPSASPPKKKVAVANGSAATSTGSGLSSQEVASLVKLLDAKARTKMLVTAASQFPDVGNMLKKEVDAVKARESSRDLSFDHLSKSVWKVLNVEYKNLKSSRQYEASGDALNSIWDSIKQIAKGCPPHASFKTKKNGLEVCRKIGKSIWLSGPDELTSEVQKSFQYDSILEDTMQRIAKSLTPSERKDVLIIDGFEGKLQELIDGSKEYCLFEKLPDVLSTLRYGEQGLHDPQDVDSDVDGSDDAHQCSEVDDGDDDDDDE